MSKKYIAMIVLLVLSVNLCANEQTESAIEECHTDFVADGHFFDEANFNKPSEEYKRFAHESINRILNCPYTSKEERKRALQNSLGQAKRSNQVYLADQIDKAVKKIK